MINSSLKFYSYRYLSFILALPFLQFNYNLVVIVCVLSTFIFNVRLTFLDYVVFFFIIAYKSQSNDVISSQDLEQYLKIYSDIIAGVYSDAFGKGEFLLPLMFGFLGEIFGLIDKSFLSFIFVSVCYFVSVAIASRFNSAIVSVCFILFLDVNLMVHVFRQFFSSLLFLLAFFCFVKSSSLTAKIILFITSAFSFFTHTTIVLLFLIAIIQKFFSYKVLKIVLIFCFMFGVIFYPILTPYFQQMLVSFHGVDVLGKASYALEFADGDYGFRVVAFLSIISVLFLVSGDLDEKDAVVYRMIVLFFSLSLFFYTIPIVSTRIGLVSTSILTGIPIGWVLLKTQRKLSETYGGF